jgi:hypothetical protein
VQSPSMGPQPRILIQEVAQQDDGHQIQQHPVALSPTL